MIIPIRNLYYLFCYAWERFPEGDETDVGIDDHPDLPNLFAKMLINGANRLLRRGLDRGYLSVDQELRSPRGRLLIDRSLKEQSKLRAAIYCSTDDLSHNILHNQIIKATAELLARARFIDKILAHELGLLSRRLGEIASMRIEANHFRRVQLSRNNAQYVMLIRLCEFIYRCQLPDEGGVGLHFKDILKDEVLMSQVFEDFLRNFFYFELKERYTIGREEFRWRVDCTPGGDPSLIPAMRTDITLRSREQSIVMDAKFYAEPFPRSYGVAKLRPGHLFQLFGYMKHAGERRPQVPVSGALVYAAPSGRLRHRYRLDGHEFAVAVIDLSRPWADIRAQLLDLVDDLEDVGRHASVDH